MMYITTLTKSGQMTLPKQIRERLKVGPGAQLKIEWQDGQAVVRAQDSGARLRQIREDSAKHLKKHRLYGLNDEELKQSVTKQRADYYGKKYHVS